MIRAERKYKQRFPRILWKAPQCHQSPIEAVVHRVTTRAIVLRNYSPHGNCTHSVRPLPHSTDPCLTLCSSVGLDSSHHQQSQTAKRDHYCSQHQKDDQRVQKTANQCSSHEDPGSRTAYTRANVYFKRSHPERSSYKF